MSDAEGDESSKPSLYYVENNCEGIVCTICDSSVEWCDIARVLSCSRLFHKRCCNDSICPVCRDGKVSEEVEEHKPAEKLNDMPAGTMEMKLEVPTSFEKLHHIFGNLQQYDNNGEEAEKAPVVGDKELLGTLGVEYQHGSPNYLNKIKEHILESKDRAAVHHIRGMAFEWRKTQDGKIAAYGDMLLFCYFMVEQMGMESDRVQIISLCKALGVQASIICIDSGPGDPFHLHIGPVTVVGINLLYRPGHYD